MGSSQEIIMPPRRAVRGHSARRNVEPQEQGVPNAPELQPQGEVTNVEFQEAIRMLSQAVTNQVGQQRGARQEEADTSRIRLGEKRKEEEKGEEQQDSSRSSSLACGFRRG
uniref:Gag-pol polyprotein n=1 Tax=Solanum tuberosum TaxID=4113 RepID=M1DRV6_SOLTU